MMCGLHATKFYGDVYLGKLISNPSRNEDFTAEDVVFAPDLRPEFSDPETTPDWIYEAARINYGYAGSLSTIRTVMSKDANSEDNDSDDNDSDDNESDSDTNDSDNAPFAYPKDKYLDTPARANYKLDD